MTISAKENLEVAIGRAVQPANTSKGSPPATCALTLSLTSIVLKSMGSPTKHTISAYHPTSPGNQRILPQSDTPHGQSRPPELQLVPSLSTEIFQKYSAIIGMPTLDVSCHHFCGRLLSQNRRIATTPPVRLASAVCEKEWNTMVDSDVSVALATLDAGIFTSAWGPQMVISQ